MEASLPCPKPGQALQELRRKMLLRGVAVLFALCFLLEQSYGKFCTNTGVQSHTLRSQWLTTNGSGYHRDKQSSLIPGSRENYIRRVLQEKKKPSATSFLKASSLHDVRISLDSLQGIAQQTNLEYLLLLDVDRLVFNFRTTAGLNATGTHYGGWEAPTSELRGHFVGHYLSASALMWASTHNESLGTKMEALVDALAECQDKMGTGYLSAFPASFFDRFEALKTVWAPYYTIHKIMAGLLDQYTLAQNKKAFSMALKMASYFFDRVSAVIQAHTVERHWESLNEETGGMNDVLYQIYSITGDPKHLELAHLFDKPCFLGLLAVQADSLSGFHANTHIPIVVGAQMRYETVGDELYKDIAKFFMDVTNSSHVYATGGTSDGEFWHDPKRLGSTLETENAETCTTYNMLKVAKNLFRWTKEIAYADYYERASLNAILSTQRANVPGVMLYMTPLAPGSSKAKSYHGWGTKYDSFWCCYGTGVESFSKLGDSIYFEEQGTYPRLYIVQFISSTLAWKNAGLNLEQTVQPLNSYDGRLKVVISVSEVSAKDTSASLYVRVPHWAGSCQANLNDLDFSPSEPGSFLEVQRNWSKGDRLSLIFQAKLRLESISDERPEYESVHAIFFGPYLLAGLTDGDWSLGPVSLTSIRDWLVPVHPSSTAKLFSFYQQRYQTKAWRQQRVIESLLEEDKEEKLETRVLSYVNGQVSMVQLPTDGTSEAMHATFRLASPVVSVGLSSSPLRTGGASDLTYKVVSLELMSRPGSFLTHNGVNERITLADLRRHQQQQRHVQADSLRAVFQVLPGLSGEKDTVSFEAAGLPGCVLHSSEAEQGTRVGAAAAVAGTSVILRCGDVAGSNASSSSFLVRSGLSSYHPMSLVANGFDRSYLLFPLYAFRDERYTVYFNFSG